MSNLDSVIYDKYYGSFIGAVVGDSLGWPQEDRSNRIGGGNLQPSHILKEWKRKSGGRYQPYEESIQAGSYSDDGQLLIATARSLRYGDNWSRHFTKVELPAWLLYERGGGGATKRAAEKLSNGIVPWKLDKLKDEEVISYFNAGGNGVTMRILPHAFLSHDNLIRISQDVIKNGISTHGHPRALLSAILYAYAVHYLSHKSDSLKYGEVISYLIDNVKAWSEFPKLNKMDEWFEAAQFATKYKYLDVWAQTTNELIDGLRIIHKALKSGMMDNTQETLLMLNCFDKRIRGAGTVATLVSLYMASKYATNPLNGLIETAFMRNADTDTNASMVGGLLGAIHGSDWIINEWGGLQDFAYIQKLINGQGAVVNEESTVNFWSSRENERIKKELLQVSIGETFKFGPFEKVELKEKKSNKTFTDSINVSTYKLISDEGQCIYIKSITKNSAKVPKQKNIVSDKKIEKTGEVVDQEQFDFKFNDIKKVEKQSKSNVSSNHEYFLSTKQLMDITRLLPSRMTANKAIPILIDLYTEIELKKKKQESVGEFFTKEVINKFKSKIDEEVLIKMVNYFSESEK
ncbi:ADP-ribosylglycohydrolase family protein [Paenibacillus graminis]|uniref:ADP-ribosylglycohydrolase family protein n=1 Tax=Paenibacillus graminis TaxID=189425 RepID=UPI00046E97AF|nr:ADP-ribosylglycohydrolase family protein [Paenibacillus graminis]